MAYFQRLTTGISEQKIHSSVKYILKIWNWILSSVYWKAISPHEDVFISFDLHFVSKKIGDVYTQAARPGYARATFFMHWSRETRLSASLNRSVAPNNGYSSLNRANKQHLRKLINRKRAELTAMPVTYPERLLNCANDFSASFLFCWKTKINKHGLRIK